MAEAATEDSLGFKSTLRGHTAAPQSGIRVLEKTGLGEARVEHKKINGREVCEQAFSSEASAHSWEYYAAIDRKPVAPVVPVTGLLLDEGKTVRLIWVPLEGEVGFSAKELLELAKKRYPDSNVAVSFSFGNKPLAESPMPELVLRSTSPDSDGKITSLIDYFGRSFDWNERVKLRTYLAGQQIADFEGSLQEHLMLSV